MLPVNQRCPENGKKKFPTAIHARIQTLNIQRRRGDILYAYQCHHCGAWHLTRQIVFTELLELNLLNP